ncbi:uncharacterized protein FA14DRAFT_161621 [Meira miltonrushii]|uniref:Signal recognition particle receptor subunit beta n=1 Tax=Meira miltonrushii TaxID=1280837 RepID=A0A316VAH3_9BASI|nr:uncharacterized protein FA14DRAFT_161621 [Meira miltonrushii]PWN34078.1 hypothetical protein FA14DRAFT_161621 [Meira miltonrushii]
MAFLGAAVRWPDALGLNAEEILAKWQPHLPSPLSELSPDLLFSILVSFTVIVLLTFIITALQARHPRAIAEHATAEKGSTNRKRRLKASDTPLTLLAGPSGVGKTSLFSALAFNSVPSVHPSQRESESLINLAAPVSTSNEKDQFSSQQQRNVLLIDTPGHPRIKDRIIGDYIKQSDVIVFCLDAKEALRGGAGLGVAKEGSLIEAVDHLHQILIQLAKSRRNAKSVPPTLVLLFTRSDLSPHLANVSLSSMSADESKRRAILLTRARTAVEVELGRRRAGMGFGARRTTKVGGMSEVTGGSSNNSLLSSIFGIFGFKSNRQGDGSAADAGQHEEEDEEVIDYVDWDVLERTMSSPSKNGIGLSAGTSLERLDSDIVEGGKAICAFASVGKERGWDERSVDGLDELRRVLLKV